ncbi:MAG: PAS domain S-box protein [Steroidobacter sp.]
MDLSLTLLTSPSYLAAIGVMVAIGILALRRGSEFRLVEADVPLRAADPGRRWKYSEILEYTHDAIVIWEMDGEGIVYWNRAAEQIYGFSRREAMGKTTHLLLQTQLDGGVNQLETKLARYGVWAGELKHTTNSGRQIVVQSRLALMAQQNGRWLVLEVNRDLGIEDQRADAQHAVEAHLDTLRSGRTNA